MSLKTPLEELVEVKNAITAVLNNQSYTINGRSVSRANLKDLRELEKDRQKKYNQSIGLKPRVASARFGRAFS